MNMDVRVMGVSENMNYKNWLIRTEVDRYEHVDVCPVG